MGNPRAPLPLYDTLYMYSELSGIQCNGDSDVHIKSSIIFFKKVSERVHL